MLKKLILKSNIQILDEIKCWEESIKLSSKPLLENGHINESYIKKMIQNIKDLGPYICLAPNFAMPHARPENGVNKLGMSLLLTKKPVIFPKDKSARLFITLAAVDNNSHLDAMSNLMELLTNDMDNLLSCNTVDEIYKIIQKY